ncbi:MAG TPA: arsenite efflux transporter metallochaperone ArsD [Labilithrix sp.]|nr:arsenite efflux transporter metallochaperone ArsD [Labilithrix sp.]
MVAVRVFDPAMCCSTGICGPSIDPQLVRFAADLDWLRTQGVSVERFNLSQQPAAFADDAAVKAALETKGEAGLPLVKVNGEVKSSGLYPSRDELAAWAGIGLPAAAPEATSSGCCGPGKIEESSRAAAKSGGCCGPKADTRAPKKSGCC